MSRTTQDKFMDALEVLAATYHFEVINDRQYANTGTVRIQREIGFDTVVSFHYSFQEGYASFSSLHPLFGMPHLGGKELPYVKPSEIQERALDPIAAILKEKDRQ